jgi:hypothetical protein
MIIVKQAARRALSVKAAMFIATRKNGMKLSGK